MVNAGNPSHRRQTQPTKNPTSTHHRVVDMAKSPSSSRKAGSYQSATVMLGRVIN
jgi:hypothetical protein